jgi:hypothetical protein
MLNFLVPALISLPAMSPVAHESDSAMGSSERLFSRCGEKRLHSLVHKYKTIYVLYTTFQRMQWYSLDVVKQQVTVPTVFIVNMKRDTGLKLLMTI